MVLTKSFTTSGTNSVGAWLVLGLEVGLEVGSAVVGLVLGASVGSFYDSCVSNISTVIKSLGYTTNELVR